MDAKKLMENYPLTTAKLKGFFLDKLVESFDEFDGDPDFKNLMVESGITDQQITTVIEGNPRSCFDMFDQEEIIMNIIYTNNKGFSFYLEKETTKKSYFTTRLECERSALDVAIAALEEKLGKPEEETNEND